MFYKNGIQNNLYILNTLYSHNKKINDILICSNKYLYNNYPFEKSYKEKIEFVISKNKGKIDMDLLPEIIKYNEGHQLKKDNRVAINYALEKCIKDYSCFILDGIIYLK